MIRPINMNYINNIVYRSLRIVIKILPIDFLPTFYVKCKNENLKKNGFEVLSKKKHKITRK